MSGLNKSPLAITILIAGVIIGGFYYARESNKKIHVMKWIGAKSKINQMYYYRIMSDKKWEEVWNNHSDKPVPHVDFNKNMVIALFLGQTTNRLGIEVVDVREVNGVLRLRYIVDGVQSARYGLLTTPFGIFVLPKTTKVVSLERDASRVIDGPPEWKAEGNLVWGDNVIEGPKREILTEEENRKKMDDLWGATMKASGDNN